MLRLRLFTRPDASVAIRCFSSASSKSPVRIPQSERAQIRHKSAMAALRSSTNVDHDQLLDMPDRFNLMRARVSLIKSLPVRRALALSARRKRLREAVMEAEKSKKPAHVNIHNQHEDRKGSAGAATEDYSDSPAFNLQPPQRGDSGYKPANSDSLANEYDFFDNMDAKTTASNEDIESLRAMMTNTTVNVQNVEATSPRARSDTEERKDSRKRSARAARTGKTARTARSGSALPQHKQVGGNPVPLSPNHPIMVEERENFMNRERSYDFVKGVTAKRHLFDYNFPKYFESAYDFAYENILPEWRWFLVESATPYMSESAAGDLLLNNLTGQKYSRIHSVLETVRLGKKTKYNRSNNGILVLCQTSLSAKVPMFPKKIFVNQCEIRISNPSPRDAKKMLSDLPKYAVPDEPESTILLSRVPSSVGPQELKYHFRGFNLHPDPQVAIVEMMPYSVLDLHVVQRESKANLPHYAKSRNYQVRFESRSDCDQCMREKIISYIHGRRIYVTKYY